MILMMVFMGSLLFLLSYTAIILLLFMSCEKKTHGNVNSDLNLTLV